MAIEAVEETLSGRPEAAVRAFAREFATRDWKRLQTYLSEDVAYTVTGFPKVVGRQNVLRLWRRKFHSYRSVTCHLDRLVAQQNLVIAQQRLRLEAPGRPRMEFECMTIYEFCQTEIIAWEVHVDISRSRADLVLWQNLRRARW